jgi:hypothetical protein
MNRFTGPTAALLGSAWPAAMTMVLSSRISGRSSRCRCRVLPHGRCVPLQEQPAGFSLLVAVSELVTREKTEAAPLDERNLRRIDELNAAITRSGAPRRFASAPRFIEPSRNAATAFADVPAGALPAAVAALRPLRRLGPSSQDRALPGVVASRCFPRGRCHPDPRANLLRRSRDVDGAALRAARGEMHSNLEAAAVAIGRRLVACTHSPSNRGRQAPPPILAHSVASWEWTHA